METKNKIPTLPIVIITIIAITLLLLLVIPQWGVDVPFVLK